MAFKIAPLKSSFMMAGILGFLISLFWIPKFSTRWAFAFAVVFFIMIIASIISFTKGRPDIQLYSKAKKIR